MTPWIAPLSMGFSRQEYSRQDSPGNSRSGLPFPSPGDLPDPGIEAGSPALQADSSSSEASGKPKMVQAKYLSSIDIVINLGPILKNDGKIHIA